MERPEYMLYVWGQIPSMAFVDPSVRTHFVDFIEAVLWPVVFEAWSMPVVDTD